MVRGATAQKTGTAVGLLLDESREGRYGRSSFGVGGAKDGDDGQSDGGSDMHCPGIISQEEMALG
jgi:hypothetical protein